MTTADLHLQNDEHVTYQTPLNLTWYNILWQTVGKLLLNGIAFVILIGFGNRVVLDFLRAFLSAETAVLLTQLLCLGILPLVLLLEWVEGIAKMFTVMSILTNKRIMIKGSPRIWSWKEIQLAEVEKLTAGRGAIFITFKSGRGTKIFFISGAGKFAEEYNRLVKDRNTG